MARSILVFVAIALALISYSVTHGADAKTKGDDGVKLMIEEHVDKEYLKKAVNQCNETFKIDKSYFTALNESGSFPDETQREPKCSIRCVLVSTGVSSEDGKFDAKRTAEVFAGIWEAKKMDEIEEIARACTEDRNEPCRCERSYQFVKCVMEMEIKKHEKNQ